MQHQLESRRRGQVEDMVKSRVRDKIVARGQEVDEAKLQEYVESKQGQVLIDELLAADGDENSNAEGDAGAWLALPALPRLQPWPYGRLCAPSVLVPLPASGAPHAPSPWLRF